VGDYHLAPRRRRAGLGDRIRIALVGATILVLFYRLPLLGTDLFWAHPRSAGLAIRFSALGTPVSWGVEWALIVGGLVGFQTALGRFDISRLRLTRPLVGVVSALVLVALLASISAALSMRAVFLPVALGALWVTASYGAGAGLVTVLASLAFSAWSGATAVLSAALLVRAVALVLIYRRGRSAQDALRAGALAGVLSAAVQISISLGTGTSWRELLVLAAWYCLGGLLEGVIFSLTRGGGERLLGHVSRERLVALLDLSQPLLQRMVHRAPGSFEHSRAMANLAEQAASAIGADALLTRVGAYYHDLGKSLEPKFFVENLDSGEASPHEELSPQESARHIVHHVVGGVKVLREGGIPEAVVEFSYTHHGSQFVEYFLNKERELCQAEERELNRDRFRYPGMKPGTKETAILMVVDSIEAASRTIESPDREQLNDMVRRIVFSKLAGEQLDESGLSMKELRIICSRVVETLVHMNHHRIKYPWQEERARQFGLGKSELSGSGSTSSYPRIVTGGT